MSNTKIKLVSNEARAYEDFQVLSNGLQFIIDCRNAADAKALRDAFVEAAFGPNGRANVDAIGGELVQCWNVGRYFTAYVDPCDRAIEWCKEFLSQLTHGPAQEAALSDKLKNRARIKNLAAIFDRINAFDDWGFSLLDIYNNGQFEYAVIPAPFGTEAAAKAFGDKQFSDFDDYLTWGATLIPEGGRDGEDAWFPTITFKPSVLDLDENDAEFIFKEIADIVKPYVSDESKSEAQDPKAEAERLTSLIHASRALSAQAEDICYKDRKKRGGDFDFIEGIRVTPKWRDESKFVLWYGDGSADHLAKGYRVVAQGDTVKFVKDPSV